jgi:hypothetical protein
MRSTRKMKTKPVKRLPRFITFGLLWAFIAISASRLSTFREAGLPKTKTKFKIEYEKNNSFPSSHFLKKNMISRKKSQNNSTVEP